MSFVEAVEMLCENSNVGVRLPDWDGDVYLRMNDDRQLYLSDPPDDPITVEFGESAGLNYKELNSIKWEFKIFSEVN